ncbi:MAG: hypothetical protein C4289_17515 [Chloroflexota bacterium]
MIEPGLRMSITGGHRARAKNVILLIGDGMGFAQRDAARLLAGGSLVMDTLPVHGRVATGCADPEGNVTDSAAAATAIATGVKTRNGAIGVDPDGKPLPTVLELAKAAGKVAGLVTTCTVTDATPAAFAAHVASRADQREIPVGLSRRALVARADRDGRGQRAQVRAVEDAIHFGLLQQRDAQQWAAVHFKCIDQIMRNVSRAGLVEHGAQVGLRAVRVLRERVVNEARAFIAIGYGVCLTEVGLIFQDHKHLLAEEAGVSEKDVNANGSEPGADE